MLLWVKQKSGELKKKYLKNDQITIALKLETVGVYQWVILCLPVIFLFPAPPWIFWIFWGNSLEKIISKIVIMQWK